ISEPICQPNDVERAEAQRKPQQRAKLEIRPEARHKDRENLPEKKNGPEEQLHPLQTSLGNKGIGARVKCKTESNHQDAAEDARENQAGQIEAIIFLAKAVPQNSPAQPGDQPDLREDAGG